MWRGPEGAVGLSCCFWSSDFVPWHPMRGLAPAGYRADMPESLDDAGATERVVGVQAVYDAVARRYLDQLADELDGKPLDRALLAVLLELAGSGTVADLGCGPGHVTRWLAARHPSTVGIDLSPGMVALARARARARARAPELTFQQGSMLDLAVDDGAWSAMRIVVPAGPVEAGAMAPANPGARRGRVLASDRNASTSAGGRARARRTFPRWDGDSDRGGGVADRRVRLSRWTGWSGLTRSACSRAEEHPGWLCQRPDRRGYWDAVKRA